MESKCPLLIRLWVRESVVSSPSEVQSGAQAENGLISADRLCSQQVTANSSPFRPEKWGTTAAQPRGVGDNVPPLLRPAGYRGRGVQRGRSNENDLCFYSRQSLFNSPDPHLPSYNISKNGLDRVSTVHPHWTAALFKSTCQHAHAAVNWLSMSLSRPAALPMFINAKTRQQISIYSTAPY